MSRRFDPSPQERERIKSLIRQGADSTQLVARFGMSMGLAQKLIREVKAEDAK